MKKTSCFSPAHILLPSEQIKLEQWGCVACDQFTSDRSYWEKAEWAAAGSPSALNLILPGNDSWKHKKKCDGPII